MQPRVLQIGKHFHPDRGGIETVTKNISDAMHLQDIRADVLCTALHSEGDLEEKGYRVIRSPTNAIVAGNKTLSWDYIRQIGRLSPHYDVGILHVPNPLGVIGVLTSWRKPLILLWHADFSQRALGLVAGPLDAAIARRADAIVAPTAIHLKASNRAKHLVGKGEIIPYPFAPLPVAPASPSPLIDEVVRAAAGRQIVLAAGRLVPYKGFDVLIRAMRKAVPELYCAIVGGGPLQETLARQIATEKVGDKVMLCGQVSDAEMATLVGLARFGCLPSVTAQEMYGLTQIEMMAAHKPVVSTNLPRSGVPLVNRDGETGLLAEPGDVDGLARQLNLLASDAALYNRLGEGAAKAYEWEYSLRTVGERYAALILRLIGRG